MSRTRRDFWRRRGSGVVMTDLRAEFVDFIGVIIP